MKNILDELTRYRVKVERDGKEIVNVPGILCIPGLLIAPKLSVAGLVAAPLLGCSIHLEDAEGQAVDVGKKMQEAAETVIGTAKTAVKTVREEIDKAWESVSADDPEEESSEAEPEAEDGAEAVSDENTVEDSTEEADGIPVIHVNNSAKPE